MLDLVYALTPERIYAAADAKAAAALALGWAPRPARRIVPWHKVRGMLHCSTDTCRSRSLRHRDGEACRLVLANALSIDAGTGPLVCMEHRRHDEAPADIFYIFPQ